MALHVFYIWFCFQLAAFIYLGLVECFYNVFGMEPAEGLASTGIFCLWGLLYALSFLLPGWLCGHFDESDSRSSKSNVPRPVILFGVFASLVSVFWLVGLAGPYSGTPAEQAFDRIEPTGSSRYSGITTHWNPATWMFLAVTAGPMAILPLSCLELYKPGWGARAMIAVSIVALIIAYSVGAFGNPLHPRGLSIGFACLFGPLAGVGLLLLLRRSAGKWLGSQTPPE